MGSVLFFLADAEVFILNFDLAILIHSISIKQRHHTKAMPLLFILFYNLFILFYLL